MRPPRPYLHLLWCVNEHHREPNSVVDVVAAATPTPPVVAEASRDAGDVSGRGLTAATAARWIHVARTVGQIAGATGHRDGMDNTGRRHGVDERRLLGA